MSYIVTLTNGTVLTTIADATIDDSSSLTLIGRNYPGYGQYIAIDMVHMLEHFANGTSPPVPLAGQLWYNTTTGLLNIYNGVSWDSVSLAPTAPVGGDLAGNLPNPTIKASVNLIGVPTAPTAPFGTDTTQLATTEFVTNVATQSVAGDLAGEMPAPTIKSSVTLTGVPMAPTATLGTSTTQIATTAFVAASSSSVLTTRGRRIFVGFGTYTFTVPAPNFIINLWGAGGGGGGSQSTGGAGGAGAGGYTTLQVTGATLGDIITINLGAVGAGGSSEGTNGGNGTVSTITGPSINLVANAGLGAGAAFATGGSGRGNSGGTSTGGDLNLNGGTGQDGYVNGTLYVGGSGGAGFGGSITSNTIGTAFPGSFPAGGGGGGANGENGGNGGFAMAQFIW